MRDKVDAAPSHYIDGSVCTVAVLSQRTQHRATDEMRDKVAEAWRHQYAQSSKLCIHRMRNMRCEARSFCQMGIRCVEQTMLTGPVLAHWDTIIATPGVRASLVRATIA